MIFGNRFLREFSHHFWKLGTLFSRTVVGVWTYSTVLLDTPGTWTQTMLLSRDLHVLTFSWLPVAYCSGMRPIQRRHTTMSMQPMCVAYNKWSPLQQQYRYSVAPMLKRISWFGKPCRGHSCWDFPSQMFARRPKILIDCHSRQSQRTFDNWLLLTQTVLFRNLPSESN